MICLESKNLRKRLAHCLLTYTRAVHEQPITTEEDLTQSQDQPPISTSKHSAKEEDLIEDECFVCMRMTVRRCSSCNREALCSLNCEKKIDYVRHTFSCPGTKRPIDSTDYLCLAVLEDILPDNDKTCDDFGFSHFWDSRDRIHLFGLYVGLLRHIEVPSRTVAKWLEEGTLNENIVREYEALPAKGSYYPWFLKNRHIIERDVDINENLTRFIEKVEPYLDPGDTTADLGNCEPEQKRQGFFMFACGVNNSHPPIAREEWYHFGFCTTVEDHSENLLGGLYGRLILRCRFTEFWQAYAQGKLIDLMDRKGLGEDWQRFRHLDVFLFTPPDGSKHSVWNLVLFCRGEESEAPRGLLVDYGFINCETALDRVELKDTYKTLLQECDPLELDQACLEGKIYQFAIKHVELEKRYQRLMKNFYPLPEVE